MKKSLKNWAVISKFQDKIESSKHFLTFSEVQSYLGVKSRKTILKYVKSGELPAYKLGGTRWRVALSDIEKFLNNHCSVSQKPLSNSEFS
ncbi:MAG: helix-turn-helix domain-containing protein [Candidatus Omnitrophica bacterium]|nr:helix-turn-helix domain-containing protein [Candidatus Omnitrophota bacterium]